MEGTNLAQIKSIALNSENSKLEDAFSMQILLEGEVRDTSLKVIYQLDAINSSSAQIDLSDPVMPQKDSVKITTREIGSELVAFKPN